MMAQDHGQQVPGEKKSGWAGPRGGRTAGGAGGGGEWRDPVKDSFDPVRPAMVRKAQNYRQPLPSESPGAAAASERAAV